MSSAIPGEFAVASRSCRSRAEANRNGPRNSHGSPLRYSRGAESEGGDPARGARAAPTAPRRSRGASLSRFPREEAEGSSGGRAVLLLRPSSAQSLSGLTDHQLFSTPPQQVNQPTKDRKNERLFCDTFRQKYRLIVESRMGRSCSNDRTGTDV